MIRQVSAILLIAIVVLVLLGCGKTPSTGSSDQVPTTTQPVVDTLVTDNTSTLLQSENNRLQSLVAQLRNENNEMTTKLRTREFEISSLNSKLSSVTMHRNNLFTRLFASDWNYAVYTQLLAQPSYFGGVIASLERLQAESEALRSKDTQVVVQANDARTIQSYKDELTFYLNKLNSLRSENARLQELCNSLQRHPVEIPNDLQPQYDDLMGQLEAVQEQLDTTQERYNTLQSKYSELQSALDKISRYVIGLQWPFGTTQQQKDTFFQIWEYWTSWRGWLHW